MYDPSETPLISFPPVGLWFIVVIGAFILAHFIFDGEDEEEDEQEEKDED